jgi:hypothetical protein
MISIFEGQILHVAPMLKKPKHLHEVQATLSKSYAEVESAPVRSLADQISLDNVPFYNDHPDLPHAAYHYVCKAYQDRVVVYKNFVSASLRSPEQIATEGNLSRGSYNGWISKGSQRKIRQSMEGWMKSIEINRQDTRSKYKPKHSYTTFATLTLPADQTHSDNQIKREILMPFIQRMQREQGVQEWFWVAQPQQNGRIHFHLLFDRYVNAKDLQLYWNLSTEKLGYLTKYFESSGSLFPPSTDIRSTPPKMSAVGYLMKYVTRSPIQLPSFKFVNGVRIKSDKLYERKVLADQSVEYKEWRKIEGRVWGMSKGIRDCKVFTPDGSDRWRDFINVLQWDPSVGIFSQEHFAVYYCNVQSKMLQYDQVLLSDYRRFYRDQYRLTYVKSAQIKQAGPPIIPLPKEPPKPPPEYVQSRLVMGIKYN